MIRLRSLLAEALRDNGLTASTDAFHSLGTWDRYNNKLWFGDAYKSSYISMEAKPLPTKLAKSNTVFNMLVRSGENPNQAIQVLVIHGVHVPESQQGRGEGKRIMQQVCEVADQHNMWMMLEVSPFGEKSMSVSQLQQFYESFGFVTISGGSRPVMMRGPVVYDSSGIKDTA